MTSASTRRLLETYLEALVQGGDFAQHLDPDVEWTTMETGEHLHGRDTVRDYITALHTVAFDARVEVRNLLVDGDSAALEADFVGTHTGEFAGVAPTGRQVRLPYTVVYDVGEHGITALRVYVPVAALLQRVHGQ